MGLAKLPEDNNEIMEDRRRMKGEEPIYYPRVTVTVSADKCDIHLTAKVTPEKMTAPKGKDKTVVCVTCAKTFRFTAGEQKFYKKKNLCDPTHCPECRARKKQIFKAKEVF